MKNNFLLILLLGLCFNLKAQTIEAVDKKGTVVEIDNSKWTLTGTDIFNKNTGNVGIGTNTPTQKLQVAGSIYLNGENSAFVVDAGTQSRLGFVKKNGSGPFIGAGNNVPIIFSQLSNFGQTNIFGNIGNTFTERMRIDGNGNVGIGGAIPTNILHLNSTTNFPASNLLRYIQFSNFNTGNTSTDGTIVGINATGFAEINNRESLPIVFSTTNSERVRIDANGNVGIGTTTPTAKLEINGDLRISGGFLDSSGDIGTAGQILSSTGTLVDWISPNALSWGLTGNAGTNENTNFIGTTDAQDFVLRSNNTERIRLFSHTTNHYIGIGRNSLAGVNGGASSYTGPTLFFGDMGNISSSTGLDFIIDDDNNATNTRFTFKANGDNASGKELMQINETGNVGIGLPSGTAQAILHTVGTLRFEGLGTNTVNTDLLTTDVNGDVTTRTLSNLLSGNALTSLNGLTPSVQTFATGNTGTDFGISSSGSVHTFNLPDASATNRGLLTSTDWTAFNNKIGTVTATTPAAVTTVGTTAIINNDSANWNANQLQGNNISTTTPNNGEVLKWDATTSTWTPKNSKRYFVLNSDLINATTSFVDITDIFSNVLVGKRYNCDCKLFFISSQPSNGLAINLTAPSGIATFNVKIPTAANTTSISNLSSGGESSTLTASSPATLPLNPYGIIVSGALIPNTNGNFGLGFKSEVASPQNITIKAGSFCSLEEY